MRRAKKPADAPSGPSAVAALFAHANDRPQHMSTEHKASRRGQAVTPGSDHPAQRTLIQTYDGDRTVPVQWLMGVSLPFASETTLVIDGRRWSVVRTRVEIETLDKPMPLITTVVTVVPYAAN